MFNIRVLIKQFYIFSLMSLITLVSAQNLSDWKEDGSTGSCGWAKSDISFYAKPNDAQPIKKLNKDNNMYWVVEKQGQWVKLRGTGGDFLKGPFIGWVKLSQLQLGAFRNCN